MTACVRVSACPTSVFITSSSRSYQPGSVLTCESDGHPVPSFTWTDATSGTVVATGRNVTLDGEAFSLTCTASADFASPCSALLTVNTQQSEIASRNTANNGTSSAFKHSV